MTSKETKDILEIIEKVNELTNICCSLKSENERLKNENEFLRGLFEKTRG